MTKMKNALKSGLSALALIGLTAAPTLALTPEEALGVMGFDPASAQEVNGMLMVEGFSAGSGENTFSAERIWFDGLRVDDAGRVVFERMVIENSTQSTAMFGDIRTETFDLIRPDAATSDAVAREFAAPENMFLTDVNGWVYERIDMRNMQTAYADPTTGVLVTQTIGSASNENAGSEVIQRSVMGDFSMVMPIDENTTVTVFIGEFIGENMPVLPMEDWNPESFIDGSMTSEQMEAFAGYMVDFITGDYGRLAMSDMRVDVAGTEISLDEIDIVSTAEGDQRRSVMTLSEFAIIPSADDPATGPLMGVLSQFGTDRILINGRGESLYDVAADRWVTAGESYLEWDGVMRLASTIDLTGYGGFLERYYGAVFRVMPMIQSDPDLDEDQLTASLLPEMMAAVNLLALSELSFTLTDYTLIDGIAAIQGAEQGLDPATVRQGYAGMASMSLLSPPPGVSPELNAQLGASLVKFLGEGGSITFRMSPEAPLTVPGLTEAFAGGAPDLNMFGLSVEAQD